MVCRVFDTTKKESFMSIITAPPSKSLGNSLIIIDDSEKVVRPQDEKIAGVVNDVLQAQPEKVDKVDGEPLPVFYEELRAKGYNHLYHHLLSRGAIPCWTDREDADNKITCLSALRVMVETRKAIIERVKSAIPPGHKNVVFLLGESNAGISTAFCFLRGDEMALGKSREYISKSDSVGLIEHECLQSLTFLPNVAIVGDLAIVDYPGLGSNYGEMIALAMELALKELIDRYHPKILALYPITWTGRRSLADRFGSNLERLFEKKCCMVGFTFYFKNDEVRLIKELEKEQEKLKRKESKILKEIERDNLAIDDMEQQMKVVINFHQQARKVKEAELAEVQRKIADLQQKKAAGQDLTLLHRSVIEATEKELLRSMRWKGEPLRLDNLEDQNLLSSCLETLSKPAEEEVRLNPEKKLDPAHQKLLDRLAKEALNEAKERKKWPVKKEDIEAFEQRIVDSSLFAAILSCANPEMGELLHLPEIDSNIVRNFDKDIIVHCSNQYWRSIIDLLDKALFNEELKTREEAESEKIAAMMSKKIMEAMPTEEREGSEKEFAELTAERVTAVMERMVPEEMAKMTPEEVAERVRIMMPDEVVGIISNEIGATVSEARAEMPSWNVSAAFSEEKVKALKEKIYWAFGFLIGRSPRDPEEPETSWKTMRKFDEDRSYKTERGSVPGWARDYLGIHAPNDIFNAINSTLSPSNREENDRMIDTACSEIEKMFSAREKLKQIQDIVDARRLIRRF